MRILKSLVSPIVCTALAAGLVLSCSADAEEYYDDGCYPNVTRVNMCEHADRIVEAWRQDLPHTVGSTTTTEVHAFGAMVSAHMVLAYAKVDIEMMAASKEMTVEDLRDNWSDIMSESVTESGCTRPLFMAFVGLGGTYEYNYYYKDGGLFATIIQRECPGDL